MSYISMVDVCFRGEIFPYSCEFHIIVSLSSLMEVIIKYGRLIRIIINSWQHDDGQQC